MGLPKSMIVLPLMLALASGNAHAQWPQGPDSSLSISTSGQLPGTGISMLSDGLGGAFMTWRGGFGCPGIWQDEASFQRVSADGRLWESGLSRLKGLQPAITSDGRGGIIAVWRTDAFQTDSDSYRYFELRCQRFDAWGAPQWAEDIALPTFGDAENECFSFPWQLPSPRNPVLVSDGSGGAIAAWQEDTQITVQRITASGDTAWGPVGHWIYGGGSPRWMNAVSDQHGGVIVVYSHWGGSLRAQRIDANGTVLWGNWDSPVSVGLVMPELHQPSVASDDSGGVIVTCYKQSFGPLSSTLLVQRVDASGQLRWTNGGVRVCSTQPTRYTAPPAIIPDGDGGAVIAWPDHRAGTECFLSYQVYAQRVARSGTTLWSEDGILLSGAPDTVSDCAITTDGHGGAIVAWTRWENSFSLFWNDPSLRRPTNQIWAQRVDSQGSIRWGDSGRLLAAAAPRRRFPRLVPDDMGGAIVAWEASLSIEAQRISSSGELVSGGAPESPGSIVAIPNPARHEATFRMALHRSGHATVSIHDLSGRRVRALFEGDLEAGERWAAWDGRDDAGNRAPPGVYFARVTHPGTRAIGRVILLP